jgi:hypothetical protein
MAIRRREDGDGLFANGFGEEHDGSLYRRALLGTRTECLHRCILSTSLAVFARSSRRQRRPRCSP